MKKLSIIVFAISLFALNVLGVSAQTLTFNYADGKEGVGDVLKPLFPMIDESTQTPTVDDGSFIQAKIDSFNTTEKSVKVSLTVSNKIVEGLEAPKERTGLMAEISFDQVLVENFDISFDNEAVEDRTASLVWNIGDLKVDEVSTFTYTLTLKEDYSEDIIDQAIAVFNKTDIKVAENLTTYDKEVADCVIPMFKLVLTDNPPSDVNANVLIVTIIGLSAISLVLYLNKNNKFSKI